MTVADAALAHPVERHLAKVEVASSSLVSRSKKLIVSAIGFFIFYAGMMELVDMRDLGSRAVMCWGSTPHARTMKSTADLRACRAFLFGSNQERQFVMLCKPASVKTSLRIRSCKLYIHFPGLCGDTLCDIIAIRNQYEEKGDENNKRYPAL